MSLAHSNRGKFARSQAVHELVKQSGQRKRSQSDHITSTENGGGACQDLNSATGLQMPSIAQCHGQLHGFSRWRIDQHQNVDTIVPKEASCSVLTCECRKMSFCSGRSRVQCAVRCAQAGLLARRSCSPIAVITPPPPTNAVSRRAKYRTCIPPLLRPTALLSKPEMCHVGVRERERVMWCTQISRIRSPSRAGWQLVRMVPSRCAYPLQTWFLVWAT